MTDTMTLIDLTDAGDRGGGKAAGLARMAQAGLPVPDGAVVPAGLPDDDVARIAAELAVRFTRPLAVRSSADAEDLADASHAGQYVTVLGVPPEAAAIADAIRRVRSSAPPGVEMSVLVMPMLDAKAAGVAFTRDPVTGANHVVVEAVEGLADRLVAGEVIGDRWIIDGDEIRPVGRSTAIDAALAARVADLARRCEEAAGSPQDIEWADDGRLHLLQSRPITTLAVEPIPIVDERPPGEWMWDSTHDQIPKTTLTLSAFMPGFEAGSRKLVETFGIPLDHLAARSIGGYLHIQPVPPVGPAGGSPPPAPVLRIAFALHPKLRKITKRAAAAIDERADRRVLDEWRTHGRPSIERRLGAHFDLDLGSLADADLRRWFGEAVELTRDVFIWNMVSDGGYLLPVADLLDFLSERGAGDMQTVTSLVAGSARSEIAGSLAALSALVDPDVVRVVEAGGPDVLERLDDASPAFAAAFRRHLRVHGQRVLGLDLEYTTIVENPLLELRVVVGRHVPADPNDAAAALADEIRSGLHASDVAAFDRLLDEARATYPIREEGEAVNSRAWGALRLTALEVGRRMVAAGHLGACEDVLHLEVAEVEAWLDDPTELADLVRVRKGQRLWARANPPVDSAGGGGPDPASFPAPVRRVMRTMELVMAHDSAPAEIAEGADGVGASPGIHTGTVRLVMTPEDLDRVEPGDVLVAPLTSSPWEFAFSKVGAVVSEGGGLLSHPAIISREYGIPAVVGCAGATSRFREGEVVTVDGTAGTVRSVDAM